MADEYIRKHDAVYALAKTMPTPATPDGVSEFDHEIHIADEAFADAIRVIESIEPADVVSVSAYKQVMWERDVAVEQLKQIGKGLGEAMDDVALIAHGWKQK